MDVEEELAQLETERDRLLSKIAYHHGPFYPERKHEVKRWSVFGFEFSLADIIAALSMSPSGRPAGEPQAVQRLAECEARIVKLKAIGSSSNGPQV